MSRCLPFPPPGYALSKEKEEVLMKLIKLQKEKQRKKEERQKSKERKEGKQRKKEERQNSKERKEGKQRKKEKEKKNERKERKKEKEAEQDRRSDKTCIVEDIGQKICSDKGDFLHKEREAETEQLERSSLTEEHGHPVRSPVPSSSSDSTENSHKRKRESSPIAEAILTRLPSKKQNEFDALATAELLCATSGMTDFLAQSFCCTLNETDKSSAVVTPMQTTALEYRNLLENLVPPRFQDVPLSPENLDWLFKDKNQEIRPEKRPKSRSNSTSCCRSSTFWPRAEYLREIDAYALPYTVPY